MLRPLARPRQPVEEVPETPFYIPGTGSSTRPRRTLKQGDCFAVLDSHADIGASPGGPDGIFFCDTRYLSHLEMLLNGKQPLLLGSTVRDDNSIPHRRPDQSRYLSRSASSCSRRTCCTSCARFFSWHGAAYQRLRIQNHGDRPFDVRLSIRFRQRLRRPVRGARTAPRAPRHRDRGGSAKPRLRLNYHGPRWQSAADDAAVRASAGAVCPAALRPMRSSCSPTNAGRST